MSAPAVLLAVPLLAGAALGALVPGVWLPVLSAGLVFFWIAAITAGLARRPRALSAAAAATAFLAGSILGAIASRQALHPALTTWHEQRADQDAPVRVVGRLRADAARGDGAVSITLDTVSVGEGGRESAMDGGIRISVAGRLALDGVPRWRQGRVLAVQTVLREPIDYRDPGVGSDRLRLAREGIFFLGSVKSAALVEERGPGSTLDEAASAFRAWVRRSIAASVGCWSVKSAGVVTAILIGDRTGLDPEDERRLQDAGTYHVIAISGGNVALLTALLIALGRVLRVPGRWTAGLSIAFLGFYGVAAGLAASVLRATLAGTIFLSARVVDHRGAPLNALAVAAAVAVALDPLTILDAGFMLSFGATFGIIVAASRFAVPRRPRGRSRWRAGLHACLAAAAGLAAATICAEVALGPISARLFGRISLAGLGLNFIAIPLMSIIQIAGMIAVPVQSVSVSGAAAVGWIAHAGTVGLLWSSRLVDAAPWLVRETPPPAAWVAVVWYAAWAGLLAAPGRRLRAISVIAAVISGALCLLSPPVTRAFHGPPRPPGWSRVVFIDVGQGDATLVWPAGASPFLVDAGGTTSKAFDVGRRVTVPAMWAFDVSRLGAFALTHGDPDHIGGAAAVLRAVRPRAVWEGVPVPRNEPLQRLRALAAGAGIAWVSRRAGERITIGAAAVTVLHPPDPEWERQKVRNDDSIVLEIRIGGVAFVLPGDISRVVEPDVAARFAPAPVVVLKAPHHGSAGSSSDSFLTALHPQAVVFSAGARNPYGHPAAATVERYKAAGAAMFSTAQDGAIVMDTDGATVLVRTTQGRTVLLAAPVEPKGS